MWGEGNFCGQKFPSPHAPHPSKNFFQVMRSRAPAGSNEEGVGLVPLVAISLSGHYNFAMP
ncbi:hypothetical protein DWUX_322 [Desulfovibrio diazotrophicus]|nr:hypothetical protein DWUX_322 [Desulfovibrio diazotrophicus]